MKTLLLFSFSLFVYTGVFGQLTTSEFYTTTKKKHIHYVAVSQNEVTVYQMGQYYTKAGFYPVILQQKTLKKTSEHSYADTNFTYSVVGEKHALRIGTKKKKELKKIDSSAVYLQLNEAYYMQSHFNLSRSLRIEFPFSDYGYYNCYETWKKFQSQDLNPVAFRKEADKEIKNMADSIRKEQESYVRISAFIVSNVNKVDYLQLKDSLALLPQEYREKSAYFTHTIYEIATQNPAYFFRIAEDFPAKRDIVFSSVDNDKKLIEVLKMVEGHEQIKKEFFKAQRDNRLVQLQMLGSCVLSCGLLTWILIVFI